MYFLGLEWGIHAILPHGTFLFPKSHWKMHDPEHGMLSDVLQIPLCMPHNTGMPNALHQLQYLSGLVLRYRLNLINSVGFRWSSSLLPDLCPLCVPKGGGGVYGVYSKALEKGYLEQTRSACCTDGMFEIFVRFGRCLCPLLPLFVNRQLPCLHTNLHHVLLLPPMHHRSLWCTKESAPGM